MKIGLVRMAQINMTASLMMHIKTGSAVEPINCDDLILGNFGIRLYTLHPNT